MSKEFFKEKEVLNFVEDMGYWWVPCKRKKAEEIHKYPGVFKFNNNDKHHIHLLEDGKAPKISPMTTYPVLWGENTKHRGITIFDSFVQSTPILSSGAVTETIISFSDFWFGDVLFENKDEVKFKSLSFGINNLELWHNQDNFQRRMTNGMKTVRVSMKKPQKIDIFEDNNVKIYLGYNVQGPSSEHGQKSVSINQSARIVIKSKKGLFQYYGERDSYEYYINMIYSFFALMIGKNSFIYDCHGKIKYIRKYRGKVSAGISVKRLWRNSVSEKYFKKLNITDITLPYALIKDDLVNILEKYNSIYPKISSFVFELIKYRNGHSVIEHYILSQLIFMLEGLPRILYAQEVKEYHQQRVLTDDFEIMRKYIWGLVKSRKQKAWLNENLPKYPQARDNYEVGFRHLSEIFPYFKDNNLTDQMHKYLQYERNIAAHALENRVEADFQLSVVVITWLKTFLTMMIFEGCGVNVEILRTSLTWFPREYNYTKDYLESLLPKAVERIKNAKKLKKDDTEESNDK